MPSAKISQQANVSRQERAGVLSAVTTRTRAIALGVLVVEAIFLAAVYAMPEQHRLIAFGIAAGVVIIALVGCILIELAERREGTQPTTLRLPGEMQGHTTFLDPKTISDIGRAADYYRTASNLKFAAMYEDAITTYRKVLEIDPQHHKARYNIASCFLYLEKFKEAELNFARLAEDLKISNLNADPILKELLHGCYIQLNRICDAQGRFAEGMRYLIESLSAKPDDALSYLNLAISSIRANDRNGAEKWYGVLLKHPDQLELLGNLNEKDRVELESLGGRK